MAVKRRKVTFTPALMRPAPAPVGALMSEEHGGIGWGAPGAHCRCTMVQSRINGKEA